MKLIYPNLIYFIWNYTIQYLFNKSLSRYIRPFPPHVSSATISSSILSNFINSYSKRSTWYFIKQTLHYDEISIFCRGQTGRCSCTVTVHVKNWINLTKCPDYLQNWDDFYNSNLVKHRLSLQSGNKPTTVTSAQRCQVIQTRNLCY